MCFLKRMRVNPVRTCKWQEMVFLMRDSFLSSSTVDNLFHKASHSNSFVLLSFTCAGCLCFQLSSISSVVILASYFSRVWWVWGDLVFRPLASLNPQNIKRDHLPCHSQTWMNFFGAWCYGSCFTLKLWSEDVRLGCKCQSHLLGEGTLLFDWAKKWNEVRGVSVPRGICLPWILKDTCWNLRIPSKIHLFDMRSIWKTDGTLNGLWRCLF